jgi:ABC-2 type transport system ATP-binding protein
MTPAMSGARAPRMIEVESLTKRYGDQTAVDDLSFSAPPGVITGFLGPNGAGKSTTMRMILGLDVPTAGSTRVNGQSYRDMIAPIGEIGALLDARASHPGRSARDHLSVLALTHGIPGSRVDEVLRMVGLTEVARQRVGTFSLGMSQRLGIASALLGDPGTLILDEPVNGLDPEGIRWIRELLKGLASEGRAILLSSHLMSEMAQTADHLIIVGRGRLIADTSVEAVITEASQGGKVHVISPRAGHLADALSQIDTVTVEPGDDPSELDVTGIPASRIGEIALERGIVLHELIAQKVSLEEAYMKLTDHSVRYRDDSVPRGGEPSFAEATA